MHFLLLPTPGNARPTDRMHSAGYRIEAVMLLRELIIAPAIPCTDSNEGGDFHNLNQEDHSDGYSKELTNKGRVLQDQKEERAVTSAAQAQPACVSLRSCVASPNPRTEGCQASDRSICQCRNDQRHANDNGPVPPVDDSR